MRKFMAQHAHKDLRVVFGDEFEDEGFERIGTDDVEAADYLRGWLDRMSR